jgi:hypothetical protein
VTSDEANQKLAEKLVTRHTSLVAHRVGDSMENYFNYFTEIEEYFWKKRGTALLVSTLDWALIDSWKESHIPLEAVLKGIDRTFEKYDARGKSRRLQRINSLAYCHQEILAAVADQERATLQHASSPEPFPRDELVKFLESNAAAVGQVAERFAAQQRAESAATVRAIADSLRTMAAGMIQAASGESALNLEEAERRLTVLEEKLYSTLLQAASEDELVAWRSEMERGLAPVRRQMEAGQIAMLERQFLQRKLFENSGVPRLSLFYL